MSYMKVHYECAPCFLRQAREALDLATDDEKLKLEITSHLTDLIGQRFHPGASANELGTDIHRTIKKETNNPDPYRQERVRSNEIALKFLPRVKKVLKEDPDLKNYLKAAIAGNLLDFAALGLDIDMEALVLGAMGKELTIDHSPELEKELKKAQNVLYLADNVGEIVFDKLLIEKIQEYDVTVTVALKKKPILNDACLDDANRIGLDEVAYLTTTGTDSVGVVYKDVSPEFLELFYHSDLVIAKGLGNYEGLTEMDLKGSTVFCLLNAKCPPVAREIGVEVGDNVVLKL
jgi:damage-control phosphatase, subfamily I